MGLGSNFKYFLLWFRKRGNSEICTACRREAFFHGFWSTEITENFMKIKAGNRIVSSIDFGVIFTGFGVSFFGGKIVRKWIQNLMISLIYFWIASGT